MVKIDGAAVAKQSSRKMSGSIITGISAIIAEQEWTVMMMTDLLIAFFLGAVVGGVFGMVLMALVIGNRSDDK